MTTRPMLQSLPPREDWVTLTYIHKGGVGEIWDRWSVFQPQPSANAVPGDDSRAAGSATLGLDLGLKTTHRARKLLFVPESIQWSAPRPTSARRARRVLSSASGRLATSRCRIDDFSK